MNSSTLDGVNNIYTIFRWSQLLVLLAARLLPPPTHTPLFNALRMFHKSHSIEQMMFAQSEQVFMSLFSVSRECMYVFIYTCV